MQSNDFSRRNNSHGVFTGTPATELAALYGDQCKVLILADSAGNSSHPSLLYEFTLGSILAAIKKYKSLSKALWETRVAWGSTEQKVPGLLDMATDLTKKRSNWSRDVASAYDFSEEQASTGFPV